MRAFLRRWLIILAVCGGGLAYVLVADLTPGSAAAHGSSRQAAAAPAHSRSPVHSAGHNRRSSRAASRWEHVLSTDTRRGIVELLGTHDGSRVGWNRHIAEWGGLVGPHWWQSALAMLTLVQYARQTGYDSRMLEHVIRVTYRRNVWKPRSLEKFDFINQYMDDTVWWGLAWLEASKFELYYRHNVHDAAQYLKVAEKDASYVAHRRQCGGIVWELGSPSGTITNAEYVALTAGLSEYRRTSNSFHDPGIAARWLAASRRTLAWLLHRHLVNLLRGTVKDRLASHRCGTVLGGPLAYTEGEVADALVQLGSAMNEPSYYRVAARFLRYVLNPSHGFVVHGVLQEHCEADALCTHNLNRFDITAFKGIFTQAVSDWTRATGSREFLPFLHGQAAAVLHNTIRGPTKKGICSSPHACQFGFSWFMPLSQTPAVERLVTVGTQESALSALIAALP